jgi:YbbR domain-containing protein
MRTHSLFQSFVSNLGWMAISVLLALMIWVAANMANNPVEQNEVQAVPVRIELPEGFVLSRSPDITAVTAVVRAERNQWDLITPGDILVTADLRNLKEPGEYRIELEAEVASPLHGRVVALRPSTLTLKIDYEVEKRVAIRVVVTRDPPLGYTYPSDLTCSSTEALVRGSAERVAEVAYVEARLDLADELNPVTKVVSLIPVQNSGLRVRDVELDPASVSCDVPIQPREDVFQMPVQPKITGNPPPGYNVVRYAEIVPDTVALTGDLAAIRSLPGLVRTAPIDLTNRTETFTTEVPVDLPPGVSTVPENQIIKVTIVIEPQISTRQFEDVPVEVTGLDPTQFRATGLADTVTVFVSGPLNRLPNRENLRVVVNLSGLPVGNHQVTPQAMLMGLQDTSALSVTVSPDELSVTIEALNPTPTPSPALTLTPGSP